MNRTQPEIDARVVPIALEHVGGFHAAVDSVARERRWLAFVEAPPIESTRGFVRSNIENDVPQFVAVVGDRLVGWCDVLPKRLEGFRHCGKLGMGVIVGFRGRGIGRGLVEATLGKARENGLERIELEVYASNTPAIRLYEKVGFLSEGRQVGARKIDGHYDDNLLMALRLVSRP